VSDYGRKDEGYRLPRCKKKKTAFHYGEKKEGRSVELTLERGQKASGSEGYREKV